MTTTLTIWMQLQNVSKKQYQHHAKLWATLNKQQEMLDGAILQCWIIFGINSLFLSTTPDDKCSFRVRPYCKPQYWVRLIYSKMENFVFLSCVYKMECFVFL
jgi:hypothetical protein